MTKTPSNNNKQCGNSTRKAQATSSKKLGTNDTARPKNNPKMTNKKTNDQKTVKTHPSDDPNRTIAALENFSDSDGSVEENETPQKGVNRKKRRTIAEDDSEEEDEASFSNDEEEVVFEKVVQHEKKKYALSESEGADNDEDSSDEDEDIAYTKKKSQPDSPHQGKRQARPTTSQRK
jgi:hypothetical protein